MGPRAFTRGDDAAMAIAVSFSALQWGHAHSRVETPNKIKHVIKSKSFNGATRIHAWRLIALGGSFILE